MTILKCSDCGNYTLATVCKKCKTKTANPHPARYSPLDRHSKYRRQLKKQE